jgi:hypothetical protein
MEIQMDRLKAASLTNGQTDKCKTLADQQMGRQEWKDRHREKENIHTDE